MTVGMVETAGWTHEKTVVTWTRRCIACGSTFNLLAGHRVADCARVLNERKPS